MANGIDFSFKTLAGAATIAAQRIVSAVTGTARTVQLHQTLTALPIGITMDTALDTGAAVAVRTFGIAKLFFNDTVTSGQLVTGDTSGRGIPYSLGQTSTAISAPAGFVGLLIGPSVAATGTIAEVLVNPGFDRNAR